MTVAVGAAIGLLAAWAMTVPLYRFKELRPKTPRDVGAEDGVPIRAVLRHARCPGCVHDHTTRDVIPVLCWVRGFPHCGHPAPPLLIALQLGLPAAMAVTTGVFSSWWVTAAYLWFCAVVAAVAVVDARVWLIPWWMPWVGSAIGAVLLLAAAIVLGDPGRMLGAAIGAVGAFSVFWVLWAAAPGKLGFGDVRAAFLIGLFLGWISPLLVIWGLLIGSLVGVAIGIGSVVIGKGKHFAFGPALAFGALVAVWAHRSLLG